MQPSRHPICAIVLPAALALALVACSDNRRPYGAKTAPPGPTPANTAAPTPESPAAVPPAASSPVIPPATATDVDEKKGSETGMVGGASGTVASGGKPGSGTESGAGTGAAVSSGEKTENRK